jgi:hypothetical protein
VPPPERLVRAVRTHVAVVEDNLEPFCVLDRDWPFVGDEQVRALEHDQRQYEQAFSRLIEEGVASGHFRVTEARLVARVIMAFLGSSASWIRPASSLRPQRVGEEFATLLLEGMATRRRGAKNR